MEKEKKGLNGYIWGIVIIIFLFLGYSVYNASELYNNGYVDIEIIALVYALINILINIGIVGIIPTFIYLVNRNFYLSKTKLIYILNCILSVIISIFIFEAISETENTGIGLIGCVIFSFTIYIILKENNKRKNDGGDFDEELFDRLLEDEPTPTIFKCANCGALVNENDKKCPICSAIFEDEEEESKFNCTNCGALVNENDKKCPICSAIFEDEKKESKVKCDNCGALVNSNSKECPNCGEIFEEEESLNDYLNNLYNKAINEKNNRNFSKAKDTFTKYLERIKEATKDIKDPIYTFNNCVELTIASESGELEGFAIELNYKISNAYMYLAYIEFEKSNFIEAVKLLNKSLKYNPCNIPALFEVAEIYKVKQEINKYFNFTNKIFDKIYNIYDLAHYYRNLGYYFIEKEEWELAKVVYLYSLKYENSQTVTTEMAYIIQTSGDDSLPKKENLTKILRENDIPTFIKKDNLKIIKKLQLAIIEKNQEDSASGKFLEELININANMK